MLSAGGATPKQSPQVRMIMTTSCINGYELLNRDSAPWCQLVGLMAVMRSGLSHPYHGRDSNPLT